MARIRSVKPEFFRHEVLQDLEGSHGALHPMLVFAGLWTQCDKQGVFPWKPRQLHLDILPFLDFDLAETLNLLESAGELVHFEANGKQYGHIPTFEDHQRVSGDESKLPARYPSPPPEKPQSTTSEAPDTSKRSRNEAEKKQERSGEEAGTKQERSTDEAPSRPGKGVKERSIGKEFARDAQFENQKAEPKPGTYPRLVFEAWSELGQAAIQSPSELHFLNSVWGPISPHLKGVHSDDVLAAVSNFGKIINGPPGKYYWTGKTAPIAFFEKHLSRFIPENFNPDDFLKREFAKGAMPREERPPLPVVGSGDPEYNEQVQAMLKRTYEEIDTREAERARA